MHTYDQISAALSYDPSTGLITRKASSSSNARAGDTAGYKNQTGYVYLSVLGKSYKAHRIAWLLHYREWPSGEIDHVNGIKDDNRIVNLRDATRSENQHNRPAYSTNTSGFKGVTWWKQNSKWRADIRINGKRYYLGMYATAELAHAAYSGAATVLHKDFRRVK